jgi:hypothetical protein
VNAGARAIEQSKRFYGATYCMDVFSNNPKEIPYVEAANILRCFDEIPAADVVAVKHGRWAEDEIGHYCTACDEYALDYEGGEDMQLHPYLTPYCPLCGARMSKE